MLLHGVAIPSRDTRDVTAFASPAEGGLVPAHAQPQAIGREPESLSLPHIREFPDPRDNTPKGTLAYVISRLVGNLTQGHESPWVIVSVVRFDGRTDFSYGVHGLSAGCPVTRVAGRR
jgi:hypothetical protein